MGKINVKDKDVVIPGEELAESMDYVPAAGTYRDGDKIIASQVGIVNISGRLIKIIPLSGRYFPKTGDTVIGKVINMSFSSWFIDIGYAYDGVLSLKDATSEYIEKGADLSRYYNFGEHMLCKIVNINKSMAIDLSMKGPGLRKLKDGTIIKITPSKVPRVIGKQGSMINLIKEKTGCQISVGQNGLIWIQGTDPKNEIIAMKAVEEIEKKSHINGLTDEITKFLSKEIKK
ncbi:MAG: KH domain-containing protein [Nanoarchaeota archaeon]|nr:KH domain-containing protein [Nanoarchaeota archaeon]